MKHCGMIILAAGKGSRMNSGYPAALHRVCGKAMIDWVLSGARAAFPDVRLTAVVPEGGAVEEHIGSRIDMEYVRQADAAGEANALKCAVRSMEDREKDSVFVLFANYPMVDTEMLFSLSAAIKNGALAASVASVDEETGEQHHAGAFCFDMAALKHALTTAPDNRSIGELVAGMDDAALLLDYPQSECVRVTDRMLLWRCESAMNSRIVAKHMRSGVTVIDPVTVHIGAEVRIGRDTTLYPNVILSGNTVVGEGCEIRPNCQLHDTTLGDRCVLNSVVANEAKLGGGVSVGPFVNLRPGTVLGDGCKVGDFVEVKNSVVGAGTKLPHLSYIGDADVGMRVNVGCGSVFVNYDGHNKHRTVVGDDVFLGCQSALVAPVRVGEGAFTAAGSTITEDVPPGAMAFARSKQVNRDGYALHYRARKIREKEAGRDKGQR